MVVMEAMAHGVVPACTNVGGIPCHIIDGVTGFLVAGDETEEDRGTLSLYCPVCQMTDPF